jgi:hypothetical protein
MCEMLGRNFRAKRLAYEFGLCQPPGPCCCDIVGKLMLMCEEGDPALSHQMPFRNCVGQSATVLRRDIAVSAGAVRA